MNNPIFVTGIGTGIGKTVASAILVEALEADYWKPVQAGLEGITDTEWVKMNVTNRKSIIHPECYRLQTPASPHIAARKDNCSITIENIYQQIPEYSCNLIVEGAGGLLVPLNEKEFIIDLIIALQGMVVLVSRNYLGSINHSLLSAAVCKKNNIPVFGWFFIGYDLVYEKEISKWSNLPIIASVPVVEAPGKTFVKAMAESVKGSLNDLLCLKRR